MVTDDLAVALRRESGGGRLVSLRLGTVVALGADGTVDARPLEGGPTIQRALLVSGVPVEADDDCLIGLFGSKHVVFGIGAPAA